MSEIGVRKEGERYALIMDKEAFLELITTFNRFSLSTEEPESSKETTRRGRPPKATTPEQDKE